MGLRHRLRPALPLWRTPARLMVPHLQMVGPTVSTCREGALSLISDSFGWSVTL